MHSEALSISIGLEAGRGVYQTSGRFAKDNSFGLNGGLELMEQEQEAKND